MDTLKVNVEHTPDGLEATVHTGHNDERLYFIDKMVISIDNDTYFLELYPNQDGGYELTFSKCEQPVLEDYLACDWDELEEDQ